MIHSRAGELPFSTGVLNTAATSLGSEIAAVDATAVTQQSLELAAVVKF